MFQGLTRTQILVADVAILAIVLRAVVLILAHAAKRNSRNDLANEQGENNPRMRLDR